MQRVHGKSFLITAPLVAAAFFGLFALTEWKIFGACGALTVLNIPIVAVQMLFRR